MSARNWSTFESVTPALPSSSRVAAVLHPISSNSVWMDALSDSMVFVAAVYLISSASERASTAATFSSSACR